jgi:hypothetical protein
MSNPLSLGAEDAAGMRQELGRSGKQGFQWLRVRDNDFLSNFLLYCTYSFCKTGIAQYTFTRGSNAGMHENFFSSNLLSVPVILMREREQNEKKKEVKKDHGPRSRA